MNEVPSSVNLRLEQLERQLDAGEWAEAMITASGLAALVRTEIGRTQFPGLFESLRRRCEDLTGKVESARGALQTELDHHRRGQRAVRAYYSGALAGTD